MVETELTKLAELFKTKPNKQNPLAKHFNTPVYIGRFTLVLIMV